MLHRDYVVTATDNVVTVTQSLLLALWLLDNNCITHTHTHTHTHASLGISTTMGPRRNLARAKSVGLLTGIYQWFSPLSIFNVDPHRTGADSTIKLNIKIGGGKREFHFWDKGLRYDNLTIDKKKNTAT